MCLPLLWQINKAIRHIFNDLAKEHLQWPIWQILHPGTSLLTVFWYFQVWINLKKLFFYYLVQNQKSLFLRSLETKPFATFKWPFATCGEWRMGWQRCSSVTIALCVALLFQFYLLYQIFQLQIWMEILTTSYSNS